MDSCSFIVFEKFTRGFLHHIAIVIMLLPVFTLGHEHNVM